MDEAAVRIATICECIDHCFSFAVWCDDFARHVGPEDMMMGLAPGHALVSDATRLLSFLAIRKIDDFLRGTRSKPDDLIAADLGIDSGAILSTVGGRFITQEERTNINKGAAHLTQQLTLDADSEVELTAIISRSLPLFRCLAAQLRAQDEADDAKFWLDRTDMLIARVASSS